MERLDKLLVGRGVGTRQDIARMCRRRLVSVNGELVLDASRKVDPQARVEVNGEVVEAVPAMVLYHKPVGVISSMNDNWAREDLSDVLPVRWREHLHPVGRLDADTSGLLLFSSDGRITQYLLHPKRAVEREYIATVEGQPDEADLAKILAAGVETAEGVIVSKLVFARGDQVRVIVNEGKHRMVRRMLANAGFPVLTLHRLRYGQIELGDLEEGQLQVATPEQLGWLGRG